MKTMALGIIAGVAFGLGVSGASASPMGPGKTNKKLHPSIKSMHSETPQGDFFDNFDSYKAGSDIVGQGGWEVWYTGGDHAIVSDDTANSGKNSLKDHAASDIVQRFDISSGVWELSVQTFMPSDGGGDGFVIVMNQYGAANLDSWSMQIRFGALDGVVESQFDLNQLPIKFDEWVEYKAVIDLDNDSWDSFYGGEALGTDLIWTDNGFGNANPPILAIGALDLYSQTATFYYDDVSLKAVQGGCAPDIDGSGALDLFDFLGFVNLFNAQDPKADWDGDGAFTLFDFLGFVNDFNAGC